MASRIEVFPILFLPAIRFTNERLSIFRLEIPLKLLILIDLNIYATYEIEQNIDFALLYQKRLTPCLTKNYQSKVFTIIL